MAMKPEYYIHLFQNESTYKPEIENSAFIEQCYRDFDSQWFETLALSVQYIIIQKVIEKIVREVWVVSSAFEDFLKQKCETHEEYARALATIYLIKCQWNDVRSAWKAFPHAVGYCSDMGALALWQGECDVALKWYKRALVNKYPKSTDPFFQSFSSLFYSLAIIRNDQSPESIDKFYRLLNVASIFWKNERYVFKLLIEMKHDIELVNSRLSNALEISRNSSVAQWFVQCLILWNKNKLATMKVDTILLQALFKKLHAQSHVWLCFELSHLLVSSGLTAFRDFSEPLESEFSLKSLLSIGGISQQWMFSLNKLDRWLSKQRADLNANGSKRLIWEITLNDSGKQIIGLSPKVQSKEKKGWSYPRQIELNKLNSTAASYMTELDTQIVYSLAEERKRSINNLNLNFTMTARSLIGHPLVFLAGGNGIPINIQLGKIELVVKRQDESSWLLKFFDDQLDTFPIVKKIGVGQYHFMYLTSEQYELYEIIGSEGMVFPNEAMEEFQTRIDRLTTVVTVRSNFGLKPDEMMVEPESQIYAHLYPYGQGLRLEIRVQPIANCGLYYPPGEGEEDVAGNIAGQIYKTHRHLPSEIKRANRLIESCQLLNHRVEDWQWQSQRPLDCLELVDFLQNSSEVITQWPKGKKYAVVGQGSFSHFNLSIHNHHNWLAVMGTLTINENVQLEINHLLDLLGTSMGRFLEIAPDHYISLNKRFLKQLELLKLYSEKKDTLLKIHPLYTEFLEELFSQSHMEESSSWKEIFYKISQLDNLNVSVPDLLQANLRDYQVEGFHWLSKLAYWGVGACLADDMGLGKTLQAIALILSRASRGATLVIAPTSVSMNWVHEIEKFAPSLKTYMWKDKQRGELIKQLKAGDVFITTYGLLNNEVENLCQIEWSNLILDEAQLVKNYQSKRFHAVMQIKAEFKMILTGTPIENHLGELWSLFNFINPGLLGSIGQFNSTYITEDKDGRALGRLRKLLSPFILRRLKNQVLQELPSKTEMVISVEMALSERAVYEVLRQKGVNAIEKILENDNQSVPQRFAILKEIMRLRQACCHLSLVEPLWQGENAKLDMLMEIVHNLKLNGHRAIIFSQFVRFLKIISKRFDQEQVSYLYLDGQMSVPSRNNVIDSFQNGQGDFFIASLKAGGVGINLTAADYVIHTDIWWNPAVEDQAADRVYRMGQTKPVTVYKLVVKDSIEEKILQLHQEKRDLANALLRGSTLGKRIEMSELLELFNLRS